MPTDDLDHLAPAPAIVPLPIAPGTAAPAHDSPLAPLTDDNLTLLELVFHHAALFATEVVASEATSLREGDELTQVEVLTASSRSWAAGEP